MTLPLERIREAILDQQTEFETLCKSEDFVRRHVQIHEIPGMASVVIGIRRSGKSTLLVQHLKNEILSEKTPWLYVNFIDERLSSLEAAQLNDLIRVRAESLESGALPLLYIFDEIQAVPGWESFVERLVRQKQNRVLITGSSAKMLSREMATQLRGRTHASELFPFQFCELIKARAIKTGSSTQESVERMKVFKAYLRQGGFPGVVNPLVKALPLIQQRSVLQSYFETLFFRDIVERNRVTSIPLMKAFTHLLDQQFAAPFTVNKSNERLKSLGLPSDKTKISEMLQWVEDCYLAFSVPLFTESHHRKLANPKKIYWIDNGLLLANSSSAEANSGRLLENAVFLALRSRGHALAYFKDEKQRETDFVVDQKYLIQVCERLDEPSTREREIHALEAAMQRLGLNKALVISLETQETIVLGTKPKRTIEVVRACDWMKQWNLDLPS